MATTFSSRDFNREPGRIKRAAIDGPVIITERGEPTLAVMNYSEYRRLTGHPNDILTALALPGIGDIDLDLSRPASFPRAAVFD